MPLVFDYAIDRLFDVYRAVGRSCDWSSVRRGRGRLRCGSPCHSTASIAQIVDLKKYK